MIIGRPLRALSATLAAVSPVPSQKIQRDRHLCNPSMGCLIVNTLEHHRSPLTYHSSIPTFPPGRRSYGPEANCERSELNWALVKPVYLAVYKIFIFFLKFFDRKSDITTEGKSKEVKYDYICLSS